MNEDEYVQWVKEQLKELGPRYAQDFHDILHERYDRIYDMIEKTVEANMLSVHTDCPAIERFAWQEPNHLMAPPIFYMRDGRKLWDALPEPLEDESKRGRFYQPRPWRLVQSPK